MPSPLVAHLQPFRRARAVGFVVGGTLLALVGFAGTATATLSLIFRPDEIHAASIGLPASIVCGILGGALLVAWRRAETRYGAQAATLVSATPALAVLKPATKSRIPWGDIEAVGLHSGGLMIHASKGAEPVPFHHISKARVLRWDRSRWRNRHLYRGFGSVERWIQGRRDLRTGVPHDHIEVLVFHGAFRRMTARLDSHWDPADLVAIAQALEQHGVRVRAFHPARSRPTAAR